MQICVDVLDAFDVRHVNDFNCRKWFIKLSCEIVSILKIVTEKYKPVSRFHLKCNYIKLTFPTAFLITPSININCRQSFIVAEAL